MLLKMGSLSKDDFCISSFMTFEKQIHFTHYLVSDSESKLGQRFK